MSHPRRVSAGLVAALVAIATTPLASQQVGWVLGAGPAYYGFGKNNAAGGEVGLAAPLARRVELDVRLHGFAQVGGRGTFGGIAADLGVGLLLPVRGLDLLVAAGPSAILVGDRDSGAGGFGGYLGLRARVWLSGRLGCYGDVTGRLYNGSAETYGLGAGVVLRLGGGP